MAINSARPTTLIGAPAAKAAASSTPMPKFPGVGPSCPAWPPETVPAPTGGAAAPAQPFPAPAPAGTSATSAAPFSQTLGSAALAAPPDESAAQVSPAPLDSTGGALPAESAGPSSTAAELPLARDSDATAKATPTTRARPKTSVADALANSAAAASMLAGSVAPASSPGETFTKAPDTADTGSAAVAATASAPAATATPLVPFEPQAAVVAPALTQAQSALPGGLQAPDTSGADDAPDGASVEPGKSAQNTTAASQSPRGAGTADVMLTGTGVALSRRADQSAAHDDDPTQGNGFAAPEVTMARAAAEPSAPAPSPGPVRAEVGSSGWADEIGAHLVWMAHQGVSSASLRLEPEHLGPLEVRIAVHDDVASVWFGAAQAQTRAALEQALPHLKDLFAAQGLTLSDAGVSRDSPRETQYAARPGPQLAAGSSSPEAETGVAVTLPRRGLIDTYA